jgi:putative aldouronate transport system substrate-binding protein
MLNCKRIISLILVAISIFALSACSKGDPAEQISEPDGNENGVPVKDLPWLEYTVDLELSSVATTLDNPNDVVTPYIEDKFKVRVKEVIQGGSMTIGFKERLGTYAAANNLPDVIIAGNENCSYAVSTGKYGDLTEQIEKMTNLNKYMDPIFWPRFMNDGRKTQIPLAAPDVSKEPYFSDPYISPMSAWALWVREDILSQAGYSFATLQEIKEKYLDKGEVPPEGAYDISPGISTPDDLRTMLEKIKKLDIVVGDTPLIPMSTIDWSQFHIGAMFDFGHWRVDPDTGEADGFLGSPGAKEYYHWLNGLYQSGLIDPDFIVQKDDQLQQKIASGRVASGMMIPNQPDAQAALYETVGTDAVIRFIPWPKQQEGVGAFDIFENGFWRAIIRDDFEDKDRLCQYFDWFFSDEGMDILTWGPESAGLWEMVDGVKKFKDPEVENDMLTMKSGGKGADYWGLYTAAPGQYFTYLSKAGCCAPYCSINTQDFRRSYEPVLRDDIMNKAAVSLGSYDRSGRYAYGDGSEIVAGVSSYYWSKFTGEAVAPLLMAKSDDEFNLAWDRAYDEFLEETDYEEARKMMAKWFAENYNP